MKTISVTLLTTEVLDGVKRRPGETVALPEGHPIAAKTATLARLASATLAAPASPARKSDAGRD